MINKIIYWVHGRQAQAVAVQSQDRYQPERPINFVSRTDPTFYNLSKR